MIMRIFIIAVLSLIIIGISKVNSQITLYGEVRTITGVPIKGALVKLVNLNITRTTDDSGRYDFNTTSSFYENISILNNIKILGNKNQMSINFNKNCFFKFNIYEINGKIVYSFSQKAIANQNYFFDISNLKTKNCVYVAKVQTDQIEIHFKILVVNSLISNNIVYLKEISFNPKLICIEAADSIVVTHPNYCGGLGGLNARKISSTTGVQNFRMFSNDTSTNGWYASKMNFIFTPETTGVDYYKKIIPNYEEIERNVQREIQQCLWRNPQEVPSNKKWSVYNCNVNANVKTNVASTGGNTLNLNPVYCNNKSWWEIIGVQHHEMVHSYQQFYNTEGASGFGEALADALRALCGFFYWPAGTKCSGGYAQPYQTGAKYWYFIELKHPGFFYKLMNSPNTGDIANRVQTITGESLSSLCSECETKGMPYTINRGNF